MKHFALVLALFGIVTPLAAQVQNVRIVGKSAQGGTADIPALVDSTGHLLVAGATGGGGGGTSDATAANQQSQLTQATLTNTRLGDITAPAAGSANARLESLRALLAAPLAVSQSGAWSVGLTGVTGAPAAAAPTTGVAVMGTDSTNGRILLTGTSGALVIGNSNNGSTATIAAASADAAAYVNSLSVRSFGAVYNGSTWDRQRGDTNGTYVVATPTAAAANSIASQTVAAATSNVLKNSAGNVYSLNLVNSTAAGFVVLYDATAAPASGTALTTGLVRYCFPVAASQGFDKVFSIPMQMTVGAVELFSTSCTTYTAVATAPIIMTGQAK